MGEDAHEESGAARLGMVLGVAPLIVLMSVLGLADREPASAADCVSIDDFSRDAPGSFPKAWKPRKEEGRPVYRVLEEGGSRFLRAVAKGHGIQAGLEREWDLKEHPVLAWRWRPRVFPEGSDERKSKTNDSALGVYVAFPHSPMTVKAVKYVWSRSVPVRTTASASRGLTRMVVLRSGPGEPGKWREERVNVLADYRRLFEAEPEGPRGIGVLTDSDDTNSVAEGDYADFRLCKAG